MSLAFENTQEDLATVLEKFGMDLPESRIEEIYDETIAPEADRIAEAALGAETTDDDEETLSNQTSAALDEITTILFEEEILLNATKDEKSGKIIPIS